MNARHMLRRIISLTGLLVIPLLIGACSPGLYQRPAIDFQEASANLRDTYFLELEISSRAFIERGDLEDQAIIWTMPAGVSADQLKRVSENMESRRKKDIHRELRLLRSRAFDALNGYAATLVSLSQGEPTEQIQSELGGLVDDLNGTLEHVNRLGIAGDSLAELQKYIGPLQQYVGIVNDLIGIASNVIRERAIVETIGRANQSILDLLQILGEEAETAQKNAADQTAIAFQVLDNFMNHEKFAQADNAIKAEVLKRKAELQTLQQQIAAQDLAGVFDAAIKAQGALVQKAILKEPGDWALRIGQFNKDVRTAKAIVAKIESEM